MATYRKVPARILTIDYIGVTTSESDRYLKAAEKELSRLEAQVLRGDLDQGTRLTELGDNIQVESRVCFNIKQATVIIGASAITSISEESCYCCSPCLVAGTILKVRTDENIDNDKSYDELFTEEKNYYADILICQSGSSSMPAQITAYEERTSSGRTTMSSRVIQSRDFGSAFLPNVIFSDYQHHSVGDHVLVLIQPLFEFVPASYGEYSPCINQRKVANGAIENPQVTCTANYVNSSGLSCRMAEDSQIWNENADPPGDAKYYPFRILPIQLKSCL